MLNRLTRKQRKMVYVGGALVLLIPIIFLGRPAPSSENAGGLISQKRDEYQLGANTLGNVDPASASMNLMLLGLRGVAVDLLWMNAIDHREKKNWSELESTVNSIILLQPHYMRVWQFQAWNLAYNVSAELDDVADRFYWVKKGTKFLDKGINRNRDSAELYHHKGDFLGKKFGRSDEWRIFRQYFKVDPNKEIWGGGPDRDLNPNGLDNYLAAKETFIIANEKEEKEGVVQRKLARPLFRSYPMRSQMNYAGALEREGQFDDETRAGWELGNREWVQDFGREVFRTGFGGEVFLEATAEELADMSDSDSFPVEYKTRSRDGLRKIANYNYWKDRSRLGSNGDLIRARQMLHEGKRELLYEADIDKAYALLLEGMTILDEILQNESSDVLIVDPDIIEESVKSVIMLRHTATLLGEDFPAEFPLKKIWDASPDEVVRFEKAFQQRIGQM